MLQNYLVLVLTLASCLQVRPSFNSSGHLRRTSVSIENFSDKNHEESAVLHVLNATHSTLHNSGHNTTDAKTSHHYHHSSARSSGHGKIAFMFMSRGDLPLEDVWRMFFEFDAHPDQYTIYWHTHVDYKPRNDSYFKNKQMKNLIPTNWASVSVTIAQQNMIKEALKDPDNQFFCLMSESCIPLVPFSLFYRSMLGQNKSIVDACTSNPGHTELFTRWRPDLDTIHFDKEHWRKSAQWTALNRKHAEIVANDTIVIKGFANVIPCDEHYVPSLLASFKLDDETTCSDGFSYVHWSSNRATHPDMYLGDNVDANFIKRIRSTSSDSSTFFNDKCSGVEGVCHFTGRKFAGTARTALFDVMSTLFNDPTGKPFDLNPYELLVHTRIRRNLTDNSQAEYYLIEYNELHEIPDLSFLHVDINNTATMKKIRDLSNEERSLYRVGHPYSFYKNNTLLRYGREASIYLTVDGRRRCFPNWSTFVNMHYDMSMVRGVSKEELSLISAGPDLPSL